MLGLSPIGLFHTAISLAALAAGTVALVRDGQISFDNKWGTFYALTTVVSCLTAFGIFKTGGFGPAHGLAVMTLGVLSVAWVAWATKWLGSWSRYVSAVGFSASFLFHLIPGLTETTTRMPFGNPVFDGPEAPGLKAATAGLFVLFLIGATLQVRWLRAKR